MARRKFTKEQERAYWQECREAYIAMSRRMLEKCGWEVRAVAAFLFAPRCTISVLITQGGI